MTWDELTEAQATPEARGLVEAAGEWLRVLVDNAEATPLYACDCLACTERNQEIQVVRSRCEAALIGDVATLRQERR